MGVRRVCTYSCMLCIRISCVGAINQVTAESRRNFLHVKL